MDDIDNYLNKELKDNNITSKDVKSLYRYFNRKEYEEKFYKLSIKNRNNIKELLFKYFLIHDRYYFDTSGIKILKDYMKVIDCFEVDHIDIVDYDSVIEFAQYCDLKSYNFYNFARSIIKKY